MEPEARTEFRSFLERIRLRLGRKDEERKVGSADGVWIRDPWRKGPLLRHLDGLQRVYVPLRRARRLCCLEG